MNRREFMAVAAAAGMSRMGFTPELERRSGTEWICDLPEGLTETRLFFQSGSSAFIRARQNGEIKIWKFDFADGKLKRPHYDAKADEMLWIEDMNA